MVHFPYIFCCFVDDVMFETSGHQTVIELMRKLEMHTQVDVAAAHFDRMLWMQHHENRKKEHDHTTSRVFSEYERHVWGHAR